MPWQHTVFRWNLNIFRRFGKPVILFLLAVGSLSVLAYLELPIFKGNVIHNTDDSEDRYPVEKYSDPDLPSGNVLRKPSNNISRNKYKKHGGNFDSMKKAEATIGWLRLSDSATGHLPGSRSPAGRQRLADYETRSDHAGPHALGELGEAVRLDSFGPENEKAKVIFQKEEFNLLASDRMSLQRSLKEHRPQKCQKELYDIDLASASVIIVAYNEPLSTLLRTIWSVINRSRPEYLREIIVVDDGSDRKYYQNTLNVLLEKEFEKYRKLVRLVRVPHKGLIKARMHGARNASGDVLVFLDAHCEANVGWLEPLLSEIKKDSKRIVCPMIDTLKAENYDYVPSANWATGLFTWTMYFSWGPKGLTASEKRRIQDVDYEPHRTPTFPGGIFAIDRTWFFEAGAYDEDMEGWGGENLEMSFRIWMCHGSIYFVPCSRVAHISRGHTYDAHYENKHHGINSARMADVWLDDYKRLFYLARPDLQNAKTGNVTSRKLLREHLKCHDFQWYLDNIYPEKYVPDYHSKFWGQLWNPKTNGCLCVTVSDDHSPPVLNVTKCFPPSHNLHWWQRFSLSNNNELRRDDWCLDQKSDSEPHHLQGHLCSGETMRTWTFKDLRMINDQTTHCLTVNPNFDKLTVVGLFPCDNSPFQEWRFLQPERKSNLMLPASLFV